MTSQTINSTRLAEIVAKLRAARTTTDVVVSPLSIEEQIEERDSCGVISPSVNPFAHGTTDRYGNHITYNSAQSSFIQIAGLEARSAVLIGAAGTGKTTCQKGVVQALIQSGKAGILSAGSHKHLPAGEVPGVIICAYTRRAVANIRRNLPADLQANCITIHKLLEYQPVYYDVVDPSTGDLKTTMKFEATRNASNPLPESIRTIIYEESSMLSVDLYKQVQAALSHQVQEIFLGDIQQLPPVFGPAIPGFKLLSLPVVELTEVYRQALESPIISLAHRILSAKPLPVTDFPAWKRADQLTIHPWKKKISWEDALHTAGHFFIAALNNGAYNPEEDVILLPFNKAFGTDELNKIIANRIARSRGALTYQIIAGFNKLHLSVGDKVLYDKEDAIVTNICPNPTYYGAQPASASTTLDYWGFDPTFHASESTAADGDIDLMLAQVAASETGEDRVKKASHIVTLKMLDSDTEVQVESAGDLNSLQLAYSMTVHKFQGSEAKKVFLVLHQSHNTMISRELLYTAVTRAREELYIICESDHFIKGILSQRVKGNTIKEKAEYFKGKLTDGFILE